MENSNSVMDDIVPNWLQEQWKHAIYSYPIKFGLKRIYTNLALDMNELIPELKAPWCAQVIQDMTLQS